MQFGLMEMWHEMGFLAKSVGVILIFLSVVTLYFFVERLIVYARARSKSKQIASKLANLLKAGNNSEALTLASKKENKGSHLARISAAGVKEFMEGGEAGLGFDQQIESAQRGCDRSHTIFTQEMKRGLPIVATIATSSPFIGLFGTIGGIINAFRGMALTGSGGIGAVSSGIAEALITTAFGIGVAVIALWCYNVMNSKVEVIGAEMDNATSEVIDFFVRKKERV